MFRANSELSSALIKSCDPPPAADTASQRAADFVPWTAAREVTFPTKTQSLCSWWKFCKVSKQAHTGMTLLHPFPVGRICST